LKNKGFQKISRRSIYYFCPDVVEQGAETVEALAEEMQRTGTIYL
jgi:hypothetical protein